MTQNARGPVIDGKFELVENLGAGGMGAVFKAKNLDDSIDAEFVALKLANADVMQDRDLLERAVNEIRALRKLDHPNVVKLYHADYAKKIENTDRIPRGYLYYAMEYIPLLKLDEPDILRTLTIEQRINYILQVSGALQAVHNLGLIHRDIKPENILVNRNTGVAKLSDFGIVKAEGFSKTQTGTFLGSPRYASPEQVNAKYVDYRTDIYSLCASLYFLVALETPYEGYENMQLLGNLVSLNNQLEKLKQKMSPVTRDMTLRRIASLDDAAGSRPKRPKEIDDSIPPELEDIIWKGMAVDPDRRYQSATELGQRLQSYLSNEDKGIKTTFGGFKTSDLAQKKYRSRPRKTEQPKKNMNLIYAMIGGGIAAGVLLGVVLLGGRSNGKPNNSPVVMQDPRKNEFESLYKKVNELYSVLDKSYSEPVHSQLNANIDTCVNLLWSIDVPNETNIKTDLSDKKDKAVTLQHRSLYSGVEKQCQIFESKLKSAQQLSYELARITELESLHAKLGQDYKQIDAARVPDAKQLSAKLEGYSDAIDGLKARDPSRKYAAAEKHLSKAKRQIETAVELCDKRELKPVYEAINAARQVLSNVQNKSDPEYLQVEKQMLDLEQRAKEEEKYLAEFVLRFDRPEDADYFAGNATVNDGKLQIDGEAQLTKPFEKGDFRFFAEGDFSLQSGAYELKFRGYQLSVAKSGNEVASYIFDARKKNFVKIEKSGSVYVNGEKMLNLDNVSSQVRIKGKANLDDVAVFY